MGRGGDGIDEDADTVGPKVPGYRRARGQDDDVGVRHVLEDDLFGLLDGQTNHLRPCPFGLLSGGGGGLFRGGAHR